MKSFQPFTGGEIQTWLTRAPYFNILWIWVIILASAFMFKPASAFTREEIVRALRATVQVIAPDNEFENFSLGSGTIINADGLILTNHHVVEGDSPNGYVNDEGIAFIAVTPPDIKGEAVVKFVGVVVKADADLDLALIQIVGLADDPKAPLPANLGLTPIERGDSEALMIGDDVGIFGFPGLGENTVTYTKGTISGFLDTDRNGVYEWIKTDAEVNHGNSGGLATDTNGYFVGMPTAGNVDEGGKISLLRTGNLALNFVDSYFPTPVTGSAQILSVQFAEAINRRGQPINPAVRFASGITDLYAVFEYSGFEDGKTLTYIWYVDGFESLRDSFQWDSGANGTDRVSIYSDEGLPDGFIELELLFDGKSLYRGGVVIGEGGAPDPVKINSATFGPITFAENMADDKAVNPGVSFSNLKAVYAFFDYEGMTNGAAWTSRWYFNGQQVLEKKSVWEAGESGGYFVSLSHSDGLPVGEFTLELYIENKLAQSGKFTIVGAGPEPVREINVIGKVTDRDNKRQAVSGALIVFLKPGVLIDDWVAADFPDDMVHSSGVSNDQGEFQLDAKVTPGESYDVVVIHEEYQPVSVDKHQIPEDAEDPYELAIAMRRK